MKTKKRETAYERNARLFARAFVSELKRADKDLLAPTESLTPTEGFGWTSLTPSETSFLKNDRPLTPNAVRRGKAAKASAARERSIDDALLRETLRRQYARALITNPSALTVKDAKDASVAKVAKLFDLVDLLVAEDLRRSRRSRSSR